MLWQQRVRLKAKIYVTLGRVLFLSPTTSWQSQTRLVTVSSENTLPSSHPGPFTVILTNLPMVSFSSLNTPLEINSFNPTKICYESCPVSSQHRAASLKKHITSLSTPHSPLRSSTESSSTLLHTGMAAGIPQGNAYWLPYLGLGSGSDWVQSELPQHQFCISTLRAQTEFSQKLKQNRHKPSG